MTKTTCTKTFGTCVAPEKVRAQKCVPWREPALYMCRILHSIPVTT